jgi:putative hydrolase of the HAD superfamily
MQASAAQRAVLLDALGTLVALEPPAPLLREMLRERFAVEITDAQAVQAISAEIAYYRAHFDEGRDGSSVAALRGRCAEALRAALPASDSIARIAQAALTDALLASLRFNAFPDAGPALAAAREQGRRLVVVSNWDVSLHEVLAGLELEPLLDGIITSAQAGARKPSRAIFDQALALAGVAPGKAVHVGDSVGEDVAGARGVGVEAILLRRDGERGPPGVRTISSLAELVCVSDGP